MKSDRPLNAGDILTARKPIATKRELTAADMLIPENGYPVKYSYTEDDMARMRRMATIGMSRNRIAYVFGVMPETLSLQIKKDKEAFERGEVEEYNLHLLFHECRSAAHEILQGTAFDLASAGDQKMLKYLLDTMIQDRKQGKQKKGESAGNVLFETQLVDGSIKTQSSKLSKEEVSRFDQIVSDITS